MEPFDIDEFQKPYRKVAAVHELQESNYLLEVYKNCFKKKYGSAHLPSAADRTTIQDIRKVAGDRTAEIVEHYFKMNDQWFMKNSHSLDVLKRQLNAVNSDLEKRKGYTVSTGVIHWSTRIVCQKCDKYFTWTGLEIPPQKQLICGACGDK